MRPLGKSESRSSQLRMLAALGLMVLVLAGGASEPGPQDSLQHRALRLSRIAIEQAQSWYLRTPPTDRITIGSLVACGLFGSMVFLNRMIVVRRRKFLPGEFLRRLREKLREGKLDRGKALDLCELNPSPASRVALAAIKRWGRPVTDLERAVSMCIRVESDRLRRHVGTLRRLAVLAPLLGMLGMLLSGARLLAQSEVVLTSAIASSLSPLIAGIVLAILLMVAYDGMASRVEAIIGELDRLGAETVDAIAMSSVVETTKPLQESRQPASFEGRHTSTYEPGRSQTFESSRPHETRRHPSPPPRTPHQIRVDIPDAMIRAMEQDEDLYDV